MEQASVGAQTWKRPNVYQIETIQNTQVGDHWPTQRGGTGDTHTQEGSWAHKDSRLISGNKETAFSARRGKRSEQSPTSALFKLAAAGWIRLEWRRKWQPYSSTLAWKIPWTEEPGGLQSTGAQRVEHSLVTKSWEFTSPHPQALPL